MSYSNFKDPFGLFKRMLLSRNTTAYFILLRELLDKILVPVDFLLQGLEKKILKKSRIDSDQPVILIIGGSRNGTTLVYQTLARYLPVSYMSNFLASFHRSPIAALKLFHRFLPNSKKRYYKSYYGSVGGLNGPNDAFSIWNRWLGEDRNYIGEDMSEQSKSEMKSFFNTWIHVSKRPFLNKNNRNSLCAPMLDSVFGNVFFIEIYRDPIFVAQSLILSRRAVQGSDKIGWGLLSKDSKESEDPLSYIDDICDQVYQVNRVLAEGRKKIATKKYIRVSYENFCGSPADLIQKVSLEALDHKIDITNLAHLRFSTAANKQRLRDDEFDRIRSCFTKLDAD